MRIPRISRKPWSVALVTVGVTALGTGGLALARRRLRQIDTASSLQALGGLNSVGLHKLKGDLRDFWSVDANAGWRILFRFRDGNAYDVHILDPH